MCDCGKRKARPTSAPSPDGPMELRWLPEPWRSSILVLLCSVFGYRIPTYGWQSIRWGLRVPGAKCNETVWKVNGWLCGALPLRCCCTAGALPVRCRCVAVGDCGILWDAGRGSHGGNYGKAAPEGRLSTYKARCGTNAGVSQPRTSFLCRRCGRAASSPSRATLFSW